MFTQSPEHMTIGAAFKEIEQKRQIDPLENMPFVILKTVGPIEFPGLTNVKTTQNPMTSGLYSMLRFAAVHSRDISAGAFCKELLEKDINEKTPFDVNNSYLLN